MSRVLDLIRGEHRSIAAILHGMQYLMNETRSRGTRIDPAVFRAMLYYLDTYSDRMHHPKEDRYLFAAMRSRSREAGAIVEELEREHAGGAAALRDLEQALSATREAVPGVSAFAKAVGVHQRLLGPCKRRNEGVSSGRCWARKTGRRSTGRSWNRDPLIDQRETGLSEALRQDC
jgi:hypothetical protein